MGSDTPLLALFAFDGCQIGSTRALAELFGEMDGLWPNLVGGVKSPRGCRVRASFALLSNRFSAASFAQTMAKPVLNESEQREVTRLCIQSGILLMQHGAESALVENVIRRLGLALGVDSVEVAIMANAITVTTLWGSHCLTTVRRNEDRGINMHVVTETQRLMLAVEAGELDLSSAVVRLESIKPYRYPRWLVVLLVGISCACFARLGKADLIGCALTFCAASVAMAVRQQLVTLHFSPLVNFFVTAFVATSVAAQGLIYKLGETPKIAMASSVLLLVPGVPLINAVSDMVKGYINTGISRWTMATLLTISTCGGIVLAMNVWKVWAWL